MSVAFTQQNTPSSQLALKNSPEILENHEKSENWNEIVEM